MIVMASRLRGSHPEHVPIDWQEARQLLEQADAAIRRTPNAEETARTLAFRARELATEPPAAEPMEKIEVVEFRLGRETYAIESNRVREVYPLDNLTPIPCTPRFVAGIVNVRGEMISAIDLGKFFDLPRERLGDLAKLIVLEAGAMCFGILGDAVSGVTHIRVASIQPSLPTLAGIRDEFLKGVAGGPVIVLDAEKLIADKRIVVEEQVE